MRLWHLFVLEVVLANHEALSVKRHTLQYKIS